MAEATMAVTARNRAGKGAARAERRAGRIPAVIYGGTADPLMVSIEPGDLQREMSAGRLFSTVYTLDVAGKDERVLPRDVQMHPVNDRAQHVDFPLPNLNFQNFCASFPAKTTHSQTMPMKT